MSGGRYSIGGFGAGLDVKRFLLRTEGHDEGDVYGI
jgi:O6-methylguanine-DNA--protein-cysteine methyltransferase